MFRVLGVRFRVEDLGSQGGQVMTGGVARSCMFVVCGLRSK